MTNPTPPASYWEPPDASREEVYDEANQDADQMVSEWAEQAEMELFIDVAVSRFNEPLFTLERVQQDGRLLSEPDEQFDSIEDLRAYVEARWPLPKEE